MNINPAPDMPEEEKILTAMRTAFFLESRKAPHLRPDPMQAALSIARPAIEGPLRERIAELEKPQDWVKRLDAAKLWIADSPLFKKFISGTPLENDIPVWIATFQGFEYGAVTGPLKLKLEAAEKEADSLRRQLGEAREALDKFGKHTLLCNTNFRGNNLCTCGLEKAMRGEGGEL